MAIWGCSLQEVAHFSKEVEKLRVKLREDKKFKERVLENDTDYNRIKNFFEQFLGFLKYTYLIDANSFYRVRRIENNTPYITRKDVIYPPPDPNHRDRMNNISFRVLYTSLHEFTAMSESRLDVTYKGGNFQLTRFKTDSKFTAYKLGLFSELYFNHPRDSRYVKEEMKRLFGSEHHDITVKGYSALENAMADIMYDQSEGYHVLSSILADAIFSINTAVDAILYPSMQNRYGINIAFRKEFADRLEIEFTSFNKLEEVYNNGFFKYSTLSCCNECSSEPFQFIETKGRCCYR